MQSPSSVAAATILLILVSVAFSPCYSQLEEEPYYICVHNFSCGQTIQNVSYPFWGGPDGRQTCGHPFFELKCQNNEYPTIKIDNRAFHVQKIDQSSRTITLASSDLWQSHCTRELHNITLDNNLFTDGPINRDLLLFYNCTSGDRRTIVNNFTCKIGGIESVGFFADATLFDELENTLYATISCNHSAEVQVLRETVGKILEKSLTLEEGLRRGFELVYDAHIETACARCEGSGGICGSSEFACHCRDRTDPVTCQSTGIKKITNFFGTKLGQGGFACVFKGKLENGCLVAVKVLKGLKGNGDEFINEVATISRTSHVHIVTLLGFCFEGSHRVLINEFMPNGSLEKFINDGGSLTHCSKLDWKALYQIAVGIARGLEYLHRGCNTRILHFDIKPHNILLNEDFCPKISDFGLAKLCPQKESIISLSCARGTIGYIAPEVFSRNFGGVSHKSDVYSYRMMVLEMVGATKNISVEVDHTSEIYFPHWIYKRLELNEELELHEITEDEANASSRKLNFD